MKKKKRTKWIGQVIYSNGFFRSGIVKNNTPPHDVIRFQLYKKEKIDKDTIHIDNNNLEMTIDEALASAFVLLKAIMVYIFRASEDIRLWEYKDKIKTLRVIKKGNNAGKNKTYD